MPEVAAKIGSPKLVSPVKQNKPLLLLILCAFFKYCCAILSVREGSPDKRQIVIFLSFQ